MRRAHFGSDAPVHCVCAATAKEQQTIRRDRVEFAIVEQHGEIKTPFNSDVVRMMKLGFSNGICIWALYFRTGFCPVGGTKCCRSHVVWQISAKLSVRRPSWKQQRMRNWNRRKSLPTAVGSNFHPCSHQLGGCMKNWCHCKSIWLRQAKGEDIIALDNQPYLLFKDAELCHLFHIWSPTSFNEQ